MSLSGDLALILEAEFLQIFIDCFSFATASTCTRFLWFGWVICYPSSQRTSQTSQKGCWMLCTAQWIFCISNEIGLRFHRCGCGYRSITYRTNASNVKRRISYSMVPSLGLGLNCQRFGHHIARILRESKLINRLKTFLLVSVKLQFYSNKTEYFSLEFFQHVPFWAIEFVWIFQLRKVSIY